MIWRNRFHLRGAPIGRRTILRGLLGGSVVTLGLPFLEAFAGLTPRARASCDGIIPRRFGLFFWGNGNRPEQWRPTGEGDSWELSEELAPLANVQHKITVVSGMAVKTGNTFPHTSGAVGLLSGAAPLEASDGSTTWALPSVDQVIADAIGGETIYSSLHTSASGASGLSYIGPNNRNPPESSPYALFERVFGAGFRLPGEEGVVDPTLGLRRSVLDAVMGDVAAIQARVGAADRIRLEQHLDGVRELEQRLARLQEDPPNLESCALPEEPLPDYPDVDGRPQVSARSRAMCDLLAMALACDQTRVFGHWFSDPVSDVLYDGASAGHHSLTHNEGGDQPEVHDITTVIMEELAYFVEKLDSVPEGEGTLLDNCVMLATSEVSEGRTHSVEDMPIVIAGGGCGALRTGLHYRSYTAENASKVMLTLVRAMDIDAASYGEGDGLTEDSLSEIEA
jgi:hypothetical protein